MDCVWLLKSLKMKNASWKKNSLSNFLIVETKKESNNPKWNILLPRPKYEPYFSFWKILEYGTYKCGLVCWRPICEPMSSTGGNSLWRALWQVEIVEAGTKLPPLPSMSPHTHLHTMPRYTHLLTILWVYPPYTSHVCATAVATFYFYNSSLPGSFLGFHFGICTFSAFVNIWLMPFTHWLDVISIKLNSNS